MAITLKEYLEQQKTGKETELRDIINQRIQSELSRRRGVIAGGRERFVGEQLSPEIQAALSRAGVRGEGGARESIPREVTQQLERPLEQTLRQREFTAESQRLNLLYQQAIRLALEAGANLQESKDYAIKVVESQRQREAFAQEQEAQRESTRRLVEQEEDFSRRSLGLYEQSLDKQVDYASLVAQALSRLGGNIVGFKTSQYLDRASEARKNKGLAQFDRQASGELRVSPQRTTPSLFRQSDRLTYGGNIG